MTSRSDMAKRARDIRGAILRENDRQPARSKSRSMRRDFGALSKALRPMLELDHWVIWRRLADGRKMPFCAENPRLPASVANPETWSSYATALKAAPIQGGIGFVLKGSGLGALDLDDCFDVETGVMDDWARDLVESAHGSYVEATPSGKGLRIIGYCSGAPVHLTIKMSTGKVEIYRDTPRFITVTGNYLELCKSLMNIDDLIDATAERRNPKDASTSGLFYREVTALLDKGWSADQIAHLMRTSPGRFSKTKAAQFDREGRLEVEIRRIVAKRPPAANEAERWRIDSGQKFVEGFIPPEYLLDGVLQQRFIYSLTGRTGSGKSAVTLMLSALVGHAGAILGDKKLKAGRVLYLAGENPDDIRMRWMVMCELDPILAESDVHFLTGSVSLSRDIDRIGERVRELGGVRLIVIDTARAFFEGDDENNNVQVGEYARLLRTLCRLPGEPCVIVNCHPTKNAGNESLQPAGGGAFIVEMDGNLTCRRVASGSPTVEIYWQGKFRGPEFAPLHFELVEMTSPKLIDSEGRLIKSVAAKPNAESVKFSGRHQSEQAMEVLAVLQKSQGLSLSNIATKLGWFQKNNEPAKSKVKRIVDTLIEQGAVGKSKTGFVSV